MCLIGMSTEAMNLQQCQFEWLGGFHQQNPAVPVHLVREGLVSWIRVFPGGFGGRTVGLGVEDFGQRVVEMIDHTIQVVLVKERQI